MRGSSALKRLEEERLGQLANQAKQYITLMEEYRYIYQEAGTAGQTGQAVHHTHEGVQVQHIHREEQVQNTHGEEQEHFTHGRIPTQVDQPIF